MSNRLTIKGQVTIPKEVREFLRLTSGDSAVEFHIDRDGTVRLTKAADPERAAVQPVPFSAGSASVRRHPGFDVLSLLSGVCA